ncbi:Uncharacterized protein BM_BM1021 [Brugia malayi]|uniref:Bm1021 n=2 Tax=Brugia TaxID=6278 RepID=A0A0K0IMF0_BRUMA|nr:Uncharacterized protein BM_BM1021 [Brugia malayi]CTP81683.1 Bm1021 [Brugia malayi]VDO20032.1 unnamed protein product [Brugia timori]VIO96201.1 Uncharacterized protein BM_BM1021 [Brugia malayi]
MANSIVCRLETSIQSKTRVSHLNNLFISHQLETRKARKLLLCIASTQNETSSSLNVDICDIITCVCNPVNPQQNSHCFRPNGNSEHSSDIGPNMDNSSEELLRITTQQGQLIASPHNKMAVQS